MFVLKSVRMIVFGLTALLIAGMLVSTAYARMDPATIELLFLFDGTEDGVARDSSGNGRNGEITGAQRVDGKFGGALEFAGTVDSNIIVTGYFGVGGTNPRTTAFWWKSDDNVSRHSWVKWGTNVAGEKYYLRGDNTVAGKMTLRVEVNGGQSYGSTNVCDGEWHHLAVVFPDGADSVKDHLLYVDGVLEENPAGGDQNMDTNNTTTDLRIGTQVPGVNQHEFAKGIMDELAIFSVALTQDEIKTLMTQGMSQVLAVEDTGLATTWAGVKTQY